jgi:hypothetical protein
MQALPEASRLNGAFKTQANLAAKCPSGSIEVALRHFGRAATGIDTHLIPTKNSVGVGSSVGLGAELFRAGMNKVSFVFA